MILNRPSRGRRRREGGVGDGRELGEGGREANIN